MRRVVLQVLFLVVSFLAFCAEATAAQSVSAVGQAEIVGSNRDGARSTALTNAFRDAVEKGIGVWVQSQTEVKDAALVRDQILTRAEGYVTEHEILKEKVEGNVLVVTIKATVAVDKIGADIRSLVARVSGSMGNPSIAFVLTTWERRGENGASSDPSVVEESGSRAGKDGSLAKIDEEIWKKYPDMTINDSFQQEFLAKNFDLMATDQARQIAVAESLAKSSVDPNDRKAVRQSAAKEGASYVARGEIRILGSGVSEATGNLEVKTQIGVEVIEVGSGDVVGSYTNTMTAASGNAGEARMQSIKKNAVLAARTLAGQTVDVWQKRSLNGRQYSIEVRNIRSVRSQQLPILSAIKGLAQITSQTNSDKSTLLVKVVFKGDKEALGTGILEAVGSKPGFSEAEFDGPSNEDGKILFTFK
ncbi:MAG TPA: hypothetical protein DCZ75_13200 [Geobacter sp.]|nr:hypothetical protein [Geobacter sp.]